MSRIGPYKSYEREASLLDWAYESGYGLMSGSYGYSSYDTGAIPKECVEFCYSQYDRFGVPRPPEEVVMAGAKAAFYIIDFADPYSLLSGVSDVEISDGWAAYTYEIADDDGLVEADPETIETFEAKPGQDAEQHLILLSRPGLLALPDSIGAAIDDVLDRDMQEEGIEGMMDAASVSWLDKACGSDEVKRKAYYQLSAWAAFIWFAGPEAREFRWNYHDVFAAISDKGEALLYNGYLVDPTRWRRIDRAPNSCVVCGLDSYCVELVHIEGVTRSMCEKCLNGVAKLRGANCGTKLCRYVECPNHVEHNKEGALMRILRGRGGLNRLAQGSMPLLEGNAPKLLA